MVTMPQLCQSGDVREGKKGGLREEIRGGAAKVVVLGGTYH